MERLTFDGRFCDIAKCSLVPGGSFCESGSCSQRKTWERLKAYEDTGLTPEEIMGLTWARGKLTVGELCHMRELSQADQDGRLVVLPHGKAQWLKAILDERNRQDQKWGFPQENTYGEWGSILAEEAGELCKELNELNFGRGDPGKMETEAVQVAAVALSILEHAAVAHDVTVQVAEALGRLTRQEAEAAVERKEENT